MNDKPKLYIIKANQCDLSQVYKEHVNGLLLHFYDEKNKIITDYFNLNSFDNILMNIKPNKDSENVLIVIFDFLRSKGINTRKMNDFYQNINKSEDMLILRLNELKEILYKNEDLFPGCKICNGKEKIDQRRSFCCIKCFSAHGLFNSNFCITGKGYKESSCYHCLFKEYESFS